MKDEHGFEVIDLDEWEWLADYEDGVFTMVCMTLMYMADELDSLQGEVERLQQDLQATLETLSQEATTVTYLMTHSKDSRNAVVQLLQEAEERGIQWVWVAHKIWAEEDPAPYSARSYPSRLAEQWEPGMSYHDGRFHDADDP